MLTFNDCLCLYYQYLYLRKIYYYKVELFVLTKIIKLILTPSRIFSFNVYDIFFQKLNNLNGMMIANSCCFPKTHESIEVLALNTTTSITGGFLPEFFDINHVKIKDILVTSCGCG